MAAFRPARCTNSLAGAGPPRHRRGRTVASRTDHEVILMTVSQPTRRHAAAVWRAVRRAAAARRAIHDEQVLMWELSWQSSRVPAGRAGPLAGPPAWTGPG
jgi:hypothetical protein